MNMDTFKVHDPECGNHLFQSTCNTDPLCFWTEDTDRVVATIKMTDGQCVWATAKPTTPSHYCVSRQCKPTNGTETRYRLSPFVVKDATLCTSEEGYNPQTGECSPYCNVDDTYINTPETKHHNRTCANLKTVNYPESYIAQTERACTDIQTQHMCLQTQHCEWIAGDNVEFCSAKNDSVKFMVFNTSTKQWERIDGSTQDKITKDSLTPGASQKPMNAMDRMVCPRLEQHGSCTHGGTGEGGCGMGFECFKSSRPLAPAPTYGCTACLPVDIVSNPDTEIEPNALQACLSRTSVCSPNAAQCQAHAQEECTDGCTWLDSSGVCVDKCIHGNIPPHLAQRTSIPLNTVSPEHAWTPPGLTRPIRNACYYDQTKGQYFAAPNPDHYCNSCASKDKDACGTESDSDCVWDSGSCVPTDNQSACKCILNHDAQTSKPYLYGGAYGQGWNQLTQECSGCPIPTECAAHKNPRDCGQERGKPNLYILGDHESVCHWDTANRKCLPRPMYMNHDTWTTATGGIDPQYRPCYPGYDLDSCHSTNTSSHGAGQFQYNGPQSSAFNGRFNNDPKDGYLGCRPVRSCSQVDPKLLEVMGSTQTSNAVCATLAGDIEGEEQDTSISLPPISDMVDKLVVLGVSIANKNIADYIQDQQNTGNVCANGTADTCSTMSPQMYPDKTTGPFKTYPCQWNGSTCAPIPHQITNAPFVGGSTMNVEYETLRTSCPSGQFMARRPLLCSDLNTQDLCAWQPYQRHYKVCKWDDANQKCGPTDMNKQMASHKRVNGELTVEQPLCAPIANYCLRQQATPTPVSTYNSGYTLLNKTTGYEYAVPMTGGNNIKYTTDSLYANHFFLAHCQHQNSHNSGDSSGTATNMYNYKTTAQDLMENTKCVASWGGVNSTEECLGLEDMGTTAELSIGDLVRNKFSYIDFNQPIALPSIQHICGSHNSADITPHDITEDDYEKCMHKRPQDICKYRFQTEKEAQEACRFFNSTSILDQDTRTITTGTAQYSPRHWAHTLLNTSSPHTIPPCAGVMKADTSTYTEQGVNSFMCLPDAGVSTVSATIPTKAQFTCTQKPVGVVDCSVDTTNAHPFGNQTPPLGQSFTNDTSANTTALDAIKSDATRSVFLLTDDETYNQPSPQVTISDGDATSGAWDADDWTNPSTLDWSKTDINGTNADDDAINDLAVDLIFWAIGRELYPAGGPVDIAETKPSIQDPPGAAHSAFYTLANEDQMKSPNYTAAAGYGCLPTAGQPDMQGLYSFQCSSNCKSIWQNRPQNFTGVSNQSTQQHQANPKYNSASDCSTEADFTDYSQGNETHGYINRATFHNQMADNMCITMLTDNDMDNASDPQPSDMAWPSLNVNDDVLDDTCSGKDFNYATLSNQDGNMVGACPFAAVKSPGFLTVLVTEGNHVDNTACDD